jgi:glutamate dehydrogenase
MGRVKNWAFANLLKTTFPDSETGRPLLDAYFPKRLRDSFREQLVKHPLRREIVATAAVNAVVNQAGLRFISRMLQTTAGDIGDVVTAYLDVDREAGAEELRAKARASNLSPAREHEALLQIEAALEQGTRDALQDKTGPGARQALRDVASASRG